MGVCFGKPQGLQSPTAPAIRQLPASQQLNIMVAIFPYYSTGDGDITIQVNDLVGFISDANADWIYVQHLANGQVGLVPRNYVVKRESVEQELWYAAGVSRAECEKMLRHDAMPTGTFLVRERETELGELALTVKDIDEGTQKVHIFHYKIKRGKDQAVYIRPGRQFASLTHLIEYYCLHATDDLCCQLSVPCPRNAPREWDLSPATQGNHEIRREDITLIESLGKGNFAEVWRAKWKGRKDVAVKILKTNSGMDREHFLSEAKLMKQCRHENLVSLFGVCTATDPIYIITEYMIQGDLLKYLQKGDGKKAQLNVLMDICAQVAKGMMFLEKCLIVHRDLAARNVLVGDLRGAIPMVRVADFGLAKVFNEDYSCYVAQPGGKLPIKWTAPEALLNNIFSVKSDVWSYGILLYEVVTRGEVPYPGMSNNEVVDKLKIGYRQPAPHNCPKEVYEIMKRCWAQDPDRRDTFEYLFNFFDDYFVSSCPTYLPLE